MTLPITIDTRDGVLTATIDGRIDGQTAPRLQGQLLSAIGDANFAVLDVSRVSYMSSAGFRLLLLVHRSLSIKGGEVALVGLVEEIRDTMEMTGFLDFFALHDSLGEALEQVRNHANYATAR
jgi:anti-sigma B factor antagonist